MLLPAVRMKQPNCHLQEPKASLYVPDYWDHECFRQEGTDLLSAVVYSVVLVEGEGVEEGVGVGCSLQNHLV